MTRNIKTPTTYCPVHPTNVLHRLKYQKASGKETRNGNRGTEWIMTEWFYCEQCAVPVQVKVTVQVLAKAK